MIMLKLLDYRITNDSNNIIVGKLRYTVDGEISYDKNGNENINVIGYYNFNNLEGVLSAIENDYVFNTDLIFTDLEQVRTRVMAIKTLLNEVNTKLIASIKSR